MTEFGKHLRWIIGRTLLLSCALVASFQTARGQVEFSVSRETGAIERLSLRDDSREMNWMQEVDGSQYAWIGPEYGWGLGFFSVVSGPDSLRYKWEKPVGVRVKRGRAESRYLAGEVEITVGRRMREGDLIEEYTFTNRGKTTLRLTGIGINTPFNDNYPDAETCYRARTNAHIWRGGHAAWVNAMHMSGRPPHLGLVVTGGAIDNYEIAERGREKVNSNTRGVIILNPEDITLTPGGNYTLAWRIFSHSGHDDFFARMLRLGSVVARAEKYIYQRGETARVEFEHAAGIETPVVRLNGRVIPSRSEPGRVVAEQRMDDLGEATFELEWGGGKTTPVHCRVISGEEELIGKRAGFILRNQQLDDPADKRHGAYMVYDNETNRIYLNDTPNCNPVDRDEGRERLGMGVLMAMLYNRSGEKDEAMKASLLRYSDFVHRLQDKDYNTFSNPDLTGWNRNYNYSWVAHYWFEMFGVTGDRQYLLDGYLTMKALYRNFGHGFYAIGMPTLGYALLRDNGFPDEAASLLQDFTRVADAYLRVGRNYPTSEVNYEQAIVAPSIVHLLNVYGLTGERKYLDGARELLPLLESFGGRQPDYHLHEISIRHWDGFWFGKREFWGDTFPHYWSVLTAAAYAGWADCTGDESYRERARQILRGNLGNFFEDGSASCAFVYPARVNGREAFFHDPYANDQDWALVYYLMENDD